VTPEERIDAAIDLAVRYGGLDGSHHKAWAIAGPAYQSIVDAACDGEDGPNTYEWDTGVAP
jgi:hypothetical protein